MPHRLLDYTFTMQLQRPVMWRGAVMLAATGILLSACYQAPAPVVRGSTSSQHTTQQTTVPQPVEKPKSEPRIIVADSADSRVVPLPRAKPSPTEKTTSSPAIKAPVAASGTVRVGAGDTVYALSRHHNIGVRDIIHANQLKPPYKLLVGQTLRLPIARFHTARAGETLYGLSQQYGVDMSALVRANAIPAPYRLVIGHRLRLPGAVPRATNRVLQTDAKPAQPVKRAAKGLPTKPPSRASKYFLWPAEGRLLSSFGPKEGGLHNDGINFSLSQGAPIRASENGVVAYAGNELPGYGNLLLVRHDGGWISAYAHNETLLVSRGDLVTRGQVISHAGSTGNVSSPQAHFELRRNGKPVNPIKYLAKM